MKKQIFLIAVACFAIGGLNSFTTAFHKTEQKNMQDLAAVPSFVLTAPPVLANYSPCEVIRPKTELFIVKHESEVVPEIIAIVHPVANGPPEV
jgi:hypothetical protein